MVENQVRTCGRPTRSGHPCRVRVNGSDIACGIHSTERDRAVADAHRSGYREGFESGVRSSKESSKLRIERLERQVEELRQRLDEETRIHEVGGDQVVGVGGYAYRWRGETPLEVGDRVLLPENYVSRMKHGPGPLEATVTVLGTTYQGPLAFVLRRLDRK
ncbi:hypothetical protein GCM10007079_25440 [Nocardiopsis terrae]|uniref:Uncharacterized protein n=1 Tax=Nocardiopsis terrae TaxID=372655 RepID=A0ABR9HFP3_9ACTN|nr:hypothetical protein [Nocardiopsis terrae]MBE1457851.1 hypothetical protein [Nocardiopsis terrae]GHC83929.1 hypothetical protein GCM10007079_25440 [Nocardiopsis terrae]